MIYLRKTTDIQEIWIPRLTPEKAEKKTCYENGYEDGYREGHAKGYASGTEAGKEEILAGIDETAVTVTADTMTITPEDGKYGFSEVSIDAGGWGDERYEEGHAEGFEKGHGIGREEGREQVLESLTEKSVEVTGRTMTVVPDGDSPGMTKVNVDAAGWTDKTYQSGFTSGYTDGKKAGYESGHTAGMDEMEEYVADNSVELAVTANGEYNAAIDGGAGYIRKVDVNVPTGSTIENQEKTVTITANTSTTVTYDEGYTGLESVDIQVNVPTGETIHNQTKSVTVTGNTQSVTYDSGYTGLESVEIDAADFGDDRYQDGYAGGHAEGYSEGYSSGETDGRNEIISGLEETAVTVTADTMTISPAEGEHGFSKVDVSAGEYGQAKYQEGYESGSTDGKNEIMQGLEATAVTVTASTMLVSPGAGKYGFSEVSIDGTEYGQSNYQSGYTEGYESGNTAGYQSGHTEGYSEGQEAGKSEILGGIDATAVTVTADTMSITPAEGKYGFSKVDIDSTEYGNTKYQEGYEEGDAAGYNEGYSAGSDDTLEEVASGSVEVTYTQNGAYDAEIDGTDGYIRKVTVNVPAPEMQEKSYAVTGDTGEVLPDSGYMGMSKVSVSAADYGQERYQEGYNSGNEAGYQSGYTSGHTDGENAVKSLITAIEIDANGNYEADPDAEDYLSFTGGSEYEISDFTSSSRKRIEIRFRVGENARAICNFFNDRKYTSTAPGSEDTYFNKSGTEDGKAKMSVEMKNASNSRWYFTVPYGEWHTLVFDYAGKRYLLDGEEAYAFTGQVMGFDDNFLRLFDNPDVMTDQSLSGVDISHIYIWDDTEDGSGEPDYRFVPNPDRSGQWTDHVMTAPAVWGTDKNYGWSAVTVSVPTGDTIYNQSKSLEITANTSTTVTYDSGYTGLESVDIQVNVPEKKIGRIFFTNNFLENVMFDSESDSNNIKYLRITTGDRRQIDYVQSYFCRYNVYYETCFRFAEGCVVEMVGTIDNFGESGKTSIYISANTLSVWTYGASAKIPITPGEWHTLTMNPVADGTVVLDGASYPLEGERVGGGSSQILYGFFVNGTFDFYYSILNYSYNDTQILNDLLTSNNIRGNVAFRNELNGDYGILSLQNSIFRVFSGDEDIEWNYEDYEADVFNRVRLNAYVPLESRSVTADTTGNLEVETSSNSYFALDKVTVNVSNLVNEKVGEERSRMLSKLQELTVSDNGKYTAGGSAVIAWHGMGRSSINNSSGTVSAEVRFVLSEGGHGGIYFATPADRWEGSYNTVKHGVFVRSGATDHNLEIRYFGLTAQANVTYNEPHVLQMSPQSAPSILRIDGEDIPFEGTFSMGNNGTIYIGGLNTGEILDGCSVEYFKFWKSDGEVFETEPYEMLTPGENSQFITKDGNYCEWENYSNNGATDMPTYDILGTPGWSAVTVNVTDPAVQVQEKSVTITENGTVTEVVPDTGYAGLSKVSVAVQVPSTQVETMTQAEYDGLGEYDDNTIYLILN